MAIKLLDPVAGTILQTFGGSPEIYARFGLLGHNGIDYGCPIGTPVVAAAAGVVTKIDTEANGYGLHVRIQHPNGSKPEYRTIYAHLSEVGCKIGQIVPQGALIGRSGNSGFSTTPHLHFELRPEPQQNNGYNGAVDPTPYFEDATETPATATTEDTAEPTTNKATVVWSSLNMRPETNTTTPAIGLLYAGFVIEYEAIIEVTGGDGLEKWLKCNLWGQTVYCAAYYGGEWSVKLS